MKRLSSPESLHEVSPAGARHPSFGEAFLFSDRRHKGILFRSKTGALRLHIGFSKITLFPG